MTERTGEGPPKRLALVSELDALAKETRQRLDAIEKVLGMKADDASPDAGEDR